MQINFFKKKYRRQNVKFFYTDVKIQDGKCANEKINAAYLGKLF